MVSILQPHGSSSVHQLSLLEPSGLLVVLHQGRQESFELRDYQKQVIKGLYQFFREGKRRCLIFAPTGSGKTAIAAQILSDGVSKNRRCLFLIHRDPLLEQTQKALSNHNIEAGIIKAEHPEDRERSVQIASVQTLARREFPSDIDVIVIDEAHTVAWHQTFNRIKNHYPNAFYVGLSASPWRSKKNEFVGQHFDSIVEAPSLADLISMCHIVPPRYFGFGGWIDISELDNGEDSEGDFNKKQTEQACMKAGFNEQIVKEYLKLASDRTGIIFCSGVEQSKFVTLLFNKAGISCEHIDYKMDSKARKPIYQRLKSGQTRLISSVGTMTEGFDEPSISCVILARPTRSLSLFVQMSGRGLRTSPGKKDCLLLDFGENTKRFGFLTDSRLVQLDQLPQKLCGSGVKECPECHAMVSSFALICPICGFEFVTEEDEEDTEETELEFGELFAGDQNLHLRYLRTQIRRLYNQKINANRIWELFEKKWGYQAPEGWFIGAIFGNRDSKKGGDTPVNRQIYLNYLHAVTLIPNDRYWFKFQMELEFGKPQTTSEERQQQYQYQSHQHRYTYKKPALDDGLPKPLNWWNIFEVEPTDTQEAIKQSYRRLAMKYHPDSLNLPVDEANQKMQLLNWAYEEFKRNFT